MFVFVPNVYEYVKCFPIRSQNKNAITFNVYTNFSFFHWKAYFTLLEPFCIHAKMSCKLYYIVKNKWQCVTHHSMPRSYFVFIWKKTLFRSVWTFLSVYQNVLQIVPYCKNKWQCVTHHFMSRSYFLFIWKNPISQCLNLFVSVPKCPAYCTISYQNVFWLMYHFVPLCTKVTLSM